MELLGLVMVGGVVAWVLCWCVAELDRADRQRTSVDLDGAWRRWAARQRETHAAGREIHRP